MIRRSPSSALALSLLSVLACGCPDPAGPDLDAGPAGSDAARLDDAAIGPDDDAAVPPGVDAAAASPDAARTCELAPGPMVASTYCDLFELALFTEGGAVEARLHGRLSVPGGMDGACAAVDEVEVQEGGVTIGSLPGAGTFTTGDQRALLARGPALDAMTARCGGDTGRFGGFGLILRGRVDGGTFEARCADAEGGSRWPPALVVTCHENVDRQAFSASTTVLDFMGTSMTTVDVSMPHDPGGEVESIDSTAHVVVAGDAFSLPPPPPPFDLTGLSASVSETSGPLPGPYTSVHLSAIGDPLGPLCPTGPIGPGMRPPAMLMRLTGTSGRGRFRSDVFLYGCTRMSL